MTNAQKKDCDDCEDTFVEAGGCPALLDLDYTMDFGDCSECMECAGVGCLTGIMKAGNMSPMELYLMKLDAQNKDCSQGSAEDFVCDAIDGCTWIQQYPGAPGHLGTCVPKQKTLSQWKK